MILVDFLLGEIQLVIGFVRLKGKKLILPFSNTYKKTHKAIEITIPPVYGRGEVDTPVRIRAAQ